MNTTSKKQENPLVNLLLNLVIPTVILMKFSGESALGPTWGLILALAFPISYGIFDFYRTRKVNFFSALGVISVVLTGGISLLKLDPKYIAIKEAAIPALLGLATLISMKTPYPIVKTFLFNENLMQVSRIQQALQSRNTEIDFARVLSRASYMIASSFCLSSVLNYVLAKWIVVSAPGTEAYNSELGKMTALSFPVIMVPSMIILFAALFYLFHQVKRLTGLELEDVFIDPAADKKSKDNTNQQET